MLGEWLSEPLDDESPSEEGELETDAESLLERLEDEGLPLNDLLVDEKEADSLSLSELLPDDEETDECELLDGAEELLPDSELLLRSELELHESDEEPLLELRLGPELELDPLTLVDDDESPLLLELELLLDPLLLELELLLELDEELELLPSQQRHPIVR